MMRFALLACLSAGLAFGQAPELPRKAPEFALQTPDGKTVLLSQYRGKVVALEFMYTTCPHCQQSSQTLTRLQKELGPRGFQPLGVAFNPMAGMLIPDFVRDFQVGFPVGFAERDPVLAYLKINSALRFVVPQMVIIDRKGMIRYQSLAAGEDATTFYEEKLLRQRIEELLKEPAAGAKKAASKKKAS